MSEFTPGWIPPTDEKRAQNERYLLRNVYREPPAVVERVLVYPSFVSAHDQGNIGAALGIPALG